VQVGACCACRACCACHACNWQHARSPGTATCTPTPAKVLGSSSGAAARPWPSTPRPRRPQVHLQGAGGAAAPSPGAARPAVGPGRRAAHGRAVPGPRGRRLLGGGRGGGRGGGSHRQRAGAAAAGGRGPCGTRTHPSCAALRRSLPLLHAAVALCLWRVPANRVVCLPGRLR
jgi:hypothetical protein